MVAPNGQGQNQGFFPWDGKAAEDSLPAGTYRVRVIHAEDGYGSNSGKRMPRVGYQVIEPADYAGMSHFENYTVGSDENLTEFVKGTMGFRGLMKLLIAAQVPQANDFNAVLASLKDAELMISVSYKPEADFKNNVTNYFRLGERPAAVSEKGAKGASGPPGAGAARPAPAPAPTMPPGPQAQQGFAVPAPAPPGIPAHPIAPPAPPAPPMAPAPAQPAPVAPPVAPAAAAAEPMVTCTICQQQVPYSQFGAHIQAHASQMAK